MRISFLAVFTLFAITATGDSADPKQPPRFPANRLAKESSPYLRQHAHNPVDWHPWGTEAFEKAKKDGKLIFLSIGYSACHWCHVMERESFSNKEIAAILNKHFICIKVDREERPDIDEVYMTAVNVLGESGGWPLSMFLTPDGKPIFGGTYWPPEDKEVAGGKLTGFKTILQRVIDIDKEKRKDLLEQGDQIARMTASAMARYSRTIAIGVLDRDTVTDSTRDIDFDPEHGGIGSKDRMYAGTKFPRPATVGFLLRQSAKPSGESLRKSVALTLEKMAAGGIFDQIGGGFHRYSTERTWTVPHFEKMLYDNALLLELYADAEQLTPTPEYRRVLRDTIAFVAREMTSPEGGFYSALDADTNEKEGEFYVWSADDIASALQDPTEHQLGLEVYGLGTANFEEKLVIPTRRVTLATVAKANGLTEAELETKLTVIRKKLFDYRAKREKPFLDTKILTGWNGLMIGGLARAGQVLKDPEAIRAAEKAADFVLKQLREKDGRLLRVYAARPNEKPEARGPAFLEDYAFLAHGLLNLHDATGNAKWLTDAKAILDGMQKRFGNPDGGGFYTTAHDSEKLFARGMDSHDGAIPSGNGLAARSLTRYWLKTKDDAYRVAAEKTVRHFTSVLKSTPGSAAVLMGTLDELLANDGLGGKAVANSVPNPPANPKQTADVVTASLKADAPAANGTQTFTVTLTVAKPYHIYANPVGGKDLERSETQVEVYLGDQKADAKLTYPAGQATADLIVGEYRIYEGTIAIRGEVKRPADAGAVSVRVKVIACKDKTCLLPSTLKVDAK